MMVRLPVVLLSMIIALSAESSNVRNEGCVNPDALGAAVKNVASSDWANISETRLQSIWPTELSYQDCAEGSCETLYREDRVINGVCQCCELFHFDVSREKDTVTEKLHTVVIYYSTDEKNDTLRAAKTIAEALGMAESDAMTIGHKRVQNFQWWVDGSEHHRVALAEVRIMPRQGVWTVFFHVSRFRI